jgi:hypothetical protein
MIFRYYQHLQKDVLWLFAFSLTAFIVLFVCGHPAYAASVAGLTISPLRSEVDIDPGTVYSNHITLVNTTNKPLPVNLSAATFGVTDEDYNYSFDLSSAVLSWVRFDPSETILEPNETQTISYSIGVPIGAEPGGQYISLFARSQLETSVESGINSQEQVASLLYITINGDVTRYGKLISLHHPWLMIGASPWTAEIQDNGSTHFTSDYSLTVETLFSKRVGYVSGSALILPNSIRLVMANIPLAGIPGVYKFIYSIGLGDEPAKNITSYVLYMPPLDGLFVLVALLICANYVRTLYKKSKRNRKIR